MNIEQKQSYTEKFKKYYPHAREIEYYFTPGRVNIIGEHLDYNGGFVFPAAIDLGIYALVHLRNDEEIHLRSADFDTEISFNLNDPIVYKDEWSWANYPAGVIAQMKNNGKKINGMDIFFFSTLPQGSGLSSSAAIEVLMGYIIDHDTISEEKDRVQLAQLCQKVENEFIGVQCGIMDQFAVAMGKKDHAILLNANSLEYDYAPFDLKDYQLIIMNSKKPRKLAESKFNERQNECQQALTILREHYEIDSLAQAPIDSLKHITDDILKKRARHVITENQRVIFSMKQLKNNNINALGNYLIASHRSLKEDYEVTGFELDSLVDAANNHYNCIGARMTGAGFGGCALALVERTAINDFIKSVKIEYKYKTDIEGEFYTAEISDGVKAV